VESEDAISIIEGVFQMNARLGDIADDVRAIRRLLEEDDDGDERDEDG
jgi:hypothetical protein